MQMQGYNYLLVEPDALKNEASTVNQAIVATRTQFDEIQRIVNAVNSYWEGEGAEEHKNAFNRKLSRIEEIYDRFQENVDDLLEIAGIYETTESLNTSEAEALPSDVIV